MIIEFDDFVHMARQRELLEFLNIPKWEPCFVYRIGILSFQSPPDKETVLELLLLASRYEYLQRVNSGIHVYFLKFTTRTQDIDDFFAPGSNTKSVIWSYRNPLINPSMYTSLREWMKEYICSRGYENRLL